MDQVPSTHTAHDDNYDAFPSGLQKLAAASGILFVLLLILSIAVNAAETPDADEAPAKFLEYVTEEKDNIELGTLVTGLAAIEWLWFVGVLTSALSRAERLARGFTRVAWVTLAGGVLALALVLVGVAAIAAGATAPSGTEPSVTRALVHLNYVSFSLASAGFAAMFASAGIVILRAGGLPRWLGWLGLALSLFYTLTMFTVLEPEDNGGVFELFWPLSLLLFVIWVVGASVSLIRQVGRPADAGARGAGGVPGGGGPPAPAG